MALDGAADEDGDGRDGGMHKNRHGNYSRKSLRCSGYEMNEEGEIGPPPPNRMRNLNVGLCQFSLYRIMN